MLTRALAILLCAAAVHGATLTIASTPEGADAFVDDRYVGPTPLSLEQVAPGPHLVRLQLRAHDVWRGRADVTDEGAPVAVQLVPTHRGKLRVTSTPEGGQVFVDGDLRGSAPLTVEGLSLGLHTVQVACEGYETWSGDVDLSERLEAGLAAELESRIEAFLLARLEADPLAVTLYADLAHQYFLDQDFGRAIETLGRGLDVVGEHSGDVPPHEIKRLYFEALYTYQGQYDFASPEALAEVQPRILDAFREAVERHPGCAANYIGLGDMLSQYVSADAAAEVFDRGLDNAEPDMWRARLIHRVGPRLVAAAQAVAGQGSWADAVAAYDRVAARLPGSHYAMSALASKAGVQASQLGDRAAAVETYRQMLETWPTEPAMADYIGAMAQLQGEMGNYEDVIATYLDLSERFPRSPHAPEALMAAANVCAGQLDDIGRAVALFRKAEEAAPREQQKAVALDSARIVLQDKGHATEADTVRDEILERHPFTRIAAALRVDPESRQTVEQYDAAGTVEEYRQLMAAHKGSYHARESLLQIAALHEAAQAWEDVIATRREFMQLFPDDDRQPEQLLAIGAAYQALGDPEQAEAVYRECAEGFPQDAVTAQALLSWAHMWYSTRMDYDRALVPYLILAADYSWWPQAADARYYAGDCYLWLVEVDKAREQWRMIIDKNPGSSVAARAAESMVLVRRREGVGQFRTDAEKPRSDN